MSVTDPVHSSFPPGPAVIDRSEKSARTSFPPEPRIEERREFAFALPSLSSPSPGRCKKHSFFDALFLAFLFLPLDLYPQLWRAAAFHPADACVLPLREGVQGVATGGVRSPDLSAPPPPRSPEILGAELDPQPAASIWTCFHRSAAVPPL